MHLFSTYLDLLDSVMMMMHCFLMLAELLVFGRCDLSCNSHYGGTFEFSILPNSFPNDGSDGDEE